MTDDSESSYSYGDNYDNAIVGIAIGNDIDTEMDAQESDESFDGFVAGITAAIDDGDIDREETWFRRCTGEIPNGIEANPNELSSLPPEVQMKLVLDLRESEKATLLRNLRECSSVVERLKEQLYESEDKRMELEHAIDIENIEVQEMRREFEEMKESHKCHIKDIERIANEMIIQRKRLSAIIEERKLRSSKSSIVSSSSRTTLPSSSDNSETTEGQTCKNDSTMKGTQDQSITTAGETAKSEIEAEFERKLQTIPQYREEFERFKEFQGYYQQAATRNNQQQTSSEGSSNGKDMSTIPSWGEEYKKMLEFQLAYERLSSFVQKHSKNS
mmetsp:Transcript_22094/g.54666  ORF Transcript_22094/g.54666 Transcript_22094/m.54666 type:complete len:330 (-) Transcript_22094:1624-2613(-)